jgi:hypothetical protein
LALGGIWVYRGYEVSDLQKKLATSQQNEASAVNYSNQITQLRAQEQKTDLAAQERANEIRKSKKQDGAVAPILADSLKRL